MFVSKSVETGYMQVKKKKITISLFKQSTIYLFYTFKINRLVVFLKY